MSLPFLSRSLCCALLLPMLAVGTPVSAHVVEPGSSGSSDARARSHFTRGVGLFEDGDFESALFEFESAYQLSDNPHLLYNIAVSQYELHRYAASALAYRRYLAALERELSPDRLAQVNERLRTLELRVGTLIVDSTPSGAVVSVGGEVAGVTPVEVTVDLGETVITVTKEGFEASETTARVAGGERTSVNVDLDELAEPAAVAPVPSPRATTTSRGEPFDDSDAARNDRPLEIGTWVAFGIGLGAGIGAGVTGGLAIGANDDLDDARLRATTRDELNDLGDRRDTLALTTDVLIGVAAAAAITSVALGATLLVRRKRDRESRVAFDPRNGVVRF